MYHYLQPIRQDFSRVIEMKMIDLANMRTVVKSACFSHPNFDSARSEEERSKKWSGKRHSRVTQNKLVALTDVM